MKKVIKLTESELKQHIQKIIQEQGVKNPSTDIERLKAERDRLKKELDKLEAQLASSPKPGNQRPHDGMVADCLKSVGFVLKNTGGKYDLYMTKKIYSDQGSLLGSHMVSSQSDPTMFTTNTVVNDKVVHRGEFVVRTSTNCKEIAIKSHYEGYR